MCVRKCFFERLRRRADAGVVRTGPLGGIGLAGAGLIFEGTLGAGRRGKGSLPTEENKKILIWPRQKGGQQWALGLALDAHSGPTDISICLGWPGCSYRD